MAVGVTEYLPEFNFSTSSIVNKAAWFIIFVVLAVVIGLATWWIIKRLKFNKKIIIFEKIGGRYEQIATDFAMVMNIGRTGDQVFKLRKRNKYLPTPTIQMGRNTYWFAIREDKEWINIGLEDIDLNMRKAKANYLDKEMRYARLGLERNLKERYDAPTFLQKYGGVLAYASLIAITGIMAYLLFDKFIDISTKVAQVVELAADVQEQTKHIIAGLDNLKSGSGLSAV